MRTAIVAVMAHHLVTYGRRTRDGYRMARVNPVRQLDEGLLHGGMISRRRRREPELRGHLHQIGERVSLHLSHHVAAMCFHRDLTDAEHATDLLIQPTRDHKRHDLAFAGGERRVAVPEHADFGLVTKRGATALDSVLDSGQ